MLSISKIVDGQEVTLRRAKINYGWYSERTELTIETDRGSLVVSGPEIEALLLAYRELQVRTLAEEVAQEVSEKNISNLSINRGR
jgi:hypothetical protein